MPVRQTPYTCTCLCTHMCACEANASSHAHAYVHMHAHACAHMHAHAYVHIHAHACAHMHAHAYVHMCACEANASLISKTSTAEIGRLAACSAAGMATAGPMPITSGAQPTTW